MTHRVQMFRLDTNRGQHARGIAGVYSSFLDVFLDAGNHARGLIRKSIDVEFSSLFEKLINQYWPVRSETNRSTHVSLKRLFVVNNRHGPSAKHIAGSD